MAPTSEQLGIFLADHTGVVATVKRDYPHLSTGELTDQVAHRLNREYSTDVFGRKARQRDGSHPNEDTLTIRLDDADPEKKKLIDIWGGSKLVPPKNEPTWQVRPAHEEPNNGFWRPPVTADRDGDAPPPPDTPQPPAEPDHKDWDAMVAMIKHVEDNLAIYHQMMIDKCRENANAAQSAMNKVAHLEQRMARLKVKGRTGTRGVFGMGNHSHDVDLTVTSDP